MTDHQTLYGYIAQKFRNSELEEMSLDSLLLDAENEGYGEIWELSKHGMANALAARGLVLEEGKVKYPINSVGDNYDPEQTGFSEFIGAVKAIIADADSPVDTTDLIGLLDMHKAAIPQNSMQNVLLKENIFYIPGVGYWSAPQYVLDTGQIVSKRMKSKRMERLMSLFENYGWPIAGLDAVELTDNFVTSRYLVRQAAVPRPKIAGIGSGLYIPIDKKKDKLPISINVAKMVAELTPETLLKDKPGVRLFRLMNVFEKQSLATVKRSRSCFDGERCQTMRVTLTAKGKRLVNAILETTNDEF